MFDVYDISTGIGCTIISEKHTQSDVYRNCSEDLQPLVTEDNNYRKSTHAFLLTIKINSKNSTVSNVNRAYGEFEISKKVI